jgi:hypothetical protein
MPVARASASVNPETIPKNRAGKVLWLVAANPRAEGWVPTKTPQPPKRI